MDADLMPYEAAQLTRNKWHTFVFGTENKGVPFQFFASNFLHFTGAFLSECFGLNN